MTELVPTAVAAKAIGVHRSTLARWAQEGRVQPELYTPGGQARWNIDKLREQLRTKPLNKEKPPPR